MLGNESRQFLNCVPIFTIFLIEIFNKQRITISIKRIIYLSIYQLFISKFWLNIPSKIVNTPSINGKNYIYFISQGKWTPVPFQFTWTILFLITLLIFYKYRNNIFTQNVINE